MDYFVTSFELHKNVETIEAMDYLSGNHYSVHLLLHLNICCFALSILKTALAQTHHTLRPLRWWKTMEEKVKAQMNLIKSISSQVIKNMGNMELLSELLDLFQAVLVIVKPKGQGIPGRNNWYDIDWKAFKRAIRSLH